MMGAQFKLTGPSPKGMSTELRKPYQTGLRHVVRMDLLQPVLYIVELACRYRVDLMRATREVGEDDDHIKLFKPKLDALQGDDLDIAQGDNKKWWLRKMNKGFSGGLQFDISSMGNAVESKLPEWNIQFESLANLNSRGKLRLRNKHCRLTDPEIASTIFSA
jgi:hypothetical protein